MRNPDVLDLTGSAPGPMLERSREDGKAWTRERLSPADWTFTFSDSALEEIDRLVDAVRRAPLPLLLLEPGQFSLPACGELMGRVKRLLTDGIGFCLVDALPLERYAPEEIRAAYWVLGQLVGRTVAQKWDGTMIYDVTDTGREFGYGVRASWTNVELLFHTDNCFAVAMPEIVSLLCLSPAAEGGMSRFCSIYTVHDRLRERYPRLLPRLYEPFYFDRQAEHDPAAPKVALAPALRCDDGRLQGRLNNTLIRKGYELAGEPLDPMGAEALEALDAVMADEDLWVEFRIERGQLQLLNNLEFVHYRSAFRDGPERKRHLIRLWMRERGRRGYDG